MPALPSLLRRGLLFLALTFLLLSRVAAEPAPPLRLDAGTPAVDPWPHLTVWTGAADGDGPDAARAAPFVPPRTPHGNLGRTDRPVWLKLPVQADGGGRWVLEADFAPLDRVDGWLLAGDRLIARASMGDHVPAAEQPLDSLSPAWAFDLQPGVRHELLLRVQSGSPLVLPLQLRTTKGFERAQDDRLLLQGLLAGLGLALAFYALTQWLDQRDAMFGWYALATLTAGSYFVAHYGVGARHLWGYGHWWTDHGATVLALVGALASAMVAERLLNLRHRAPQAARVLHGCAWAAGLLAAGLLLRVVPPRVAQAGGALLILVPALVSIPLAWQCWRAGDRAAKYMLVGWVAMGCGLLPMVLLLRGLAPADFWTTHAAQLGRVLGMLAWLRVLALRTVELRRRAEQVEQQHRTLHELAHADALTGLPNRRGFDAAIQAALQRADAGERVAVFVGDLDGFKAVNDRLGHEAGDDLLVAAARRLRSRVRRGDVVARLGGDEFVVIASGLASHDAARQIGRQLVDAFGEPFALRGEGVRVGLTLGYAITPDDGTDAADLLRRADEAMYAGKRAGKSRLMHREPLAAG